jgi:hypothetical protein
MSTFQNHWALITVTVSKLSIFEVTFLPPHIITFFRDHCNANVAVRGKFWQLMVKIVSQLAQVKENLIFCFSILQKWAQCTVVWGTSTLFNLYPDLLWLNPDP